MHRFDWSRARPEKASMATPRIRALVRPTMRFIGRKTMEDFETQLLTRRTREAEIKRAVFRDTIVLLETQAGDAFYEREDSGPLQLKHFDAFSCRQIHRIIWQEDDRRSRGELQRGLLFLAKETSPRNSRTTPQRLRTLPIDTLSTRRWP